MLNGVQGRVHTESSSAHLEEGSKRRDGSPFMTWNTWEVSRKLPSFTLRVWLWHKKSQTQSSIGIPSLQDAASKPGFYSGPCSATQVTGAPPVLTEVWPEARAASVGKCSLNRMGPLWKLKLWSYKALILCEDLRNSWCEKMESYGGQQPACHEKRK